MERGSLSVSWKKTLDEDFTLSGSQRARTIALSAFTLSALPSPQARKVMVREMWESGAEVMVSLSLPTRNMSTGLSIGVQVLIDHSTTAGFECIAEAREYLLKKGRKEAAAETAAAGEWDIRGSHVVAPVGAHYTSSTSALISARWISARTTEHVLCTTLVRAASSAASLSASSGRLSCVSRNTPRSDMKIPDTLTSSYDVVHDLACLPRWAKLAGWVQLRRMCWRRRLRGCL